MSINNLQTTLKAQDYILLFSALLCRWTVIVAFYPAVFVCNLVAQTQLVRATTATESAAFVTMQWLASIKPSSGLLYTIAEELKCQVKKMGGFFQLLIQVGHTVTLYCAFTDICYI